VGVPELLGVYGPLATPAWTEAWEATEAALGELAARVRAAGARFGIVLAPAGLEFVPHMRGWQEAFYPGLRGRTWDFDHPYRRLADLLTREGIPWTFLLPPLCAHFAATGHPGYYDWDGHWDVEGHGVVADALEDSSAASSVAHQPVWWRSIAARTRSASASRSA
jgi:hypothetical protein